MQLITIAGPPSSGKTAVILRSARHLREKGLRLGVIKFDCLSTQDALEYEKQGITVKTGLSGNLCPDHFFAGNIQEGFEWGLREGFDILITESAGLCNRCSPHIKDVPAVCVIDNLSGVHTPQKTGPMLKAADIVVITKGDIVSQAEREVFAFRVRQANPRAAVFAVNGITGQGSFALSKAFRQGKPPATLEGRALRFTMPAALCSYCLGEKKIGRDSQIGNTRAIDFTKT